jgi:formamidopyrimidine-DNA glycosylase
MFARQAPMANHDHLCLELANGMEMRFNDARRFGSIAVWPAFEAAELEKAFLSSKGIEPFCPDFTASELAELASRKTLPVKSFLMDSRMIAGIGNIYANETLFAAGIHPATRVNTLSAEQWQRIIDCCLHILQKAIKAGGSTISDFLGSSGQPGYFQLQLAVYGKKGTPCSVCGTAIQKKSMGGRATFFCPVCQLASKSKAGI